MKVPPWGGLRSVLDKRAQMDVLAPEMHRLDDAWRRLLGGGMHTETFQSNWISLGRGLAGPRPRDAHTGSKASARWACLV